MNIKDEEIQAEYTSLTKQMANKMKISIKPFIHEQIDTAKDKRDLVKNILCAQAAIFSLGFTLINDSSVIFNKNEMEELKRKILEQVIIALDEL